LGSDAAASKVTRLEQALSSSRLTITLACADHATISLRLQN